MATRNFGSANYLEGRLAELEVSPHFCWFPALGNIVLLSNGLMMYNACLS